MMCSCLRPSSSVRIPTHCSVYVLAMLPERAPQGTSQVLVRDIDPGVQATSFLSSKTLGSEYTCA